MTEWAYFANESGVSRERTRRLAQDHGWITRSLTDKNGHPIANTLRLRAGDKIHLYYRIDGRKYELIASGTLASALSVGRKIVGGLDVFGEWNGDQKEIAGYGCTSGICLRPDPAPLGPARAIRPNNNAIHLLGTVAVR